MKILRCSMSFFALAVSISISVHGQESSLTYDLDLRQATTDSNLMGVDFRVLYEISRQRNDPYSLTLDLRGFQPVGEEVSDANQLSGELQLSGHFYRPGSKNPLPPQLLQRYLELSDIGLDSMTDAQEEELIRLESVRSKRNSRYFSYNFHFRFENAAGSGANSRIFGAGLSTELPQLHRLLDIVPSLTSGNNQSELRTQPVRCYLAAEYARYQEDMIDREDKNDLGRIRVEAAWSTMIFSQFTLRALWEAEYVFGDKDLPPSGHHFNAFLQAWVYLPINGSTGLEIKYLDGRLAPMYNQVSGAGLGVNFVSAI